MYLLYLICLTCSVIIIFWQNFEEFEETRQFEEILQLKERLLEIPLSPFDIHNSEYWFTTKLASNCMLPVFKEDSSFFSGWSSEQEEGQCSSDFQFITFHFSQQLYLIRWLSSFINYLHLILQILTISWTCCIDRSIKNCTW